MLSSQPIVIFGASVRAAAFSAIRAGLQPWCADLFADTDLQAFCPAIRVSFSEYPKGFVDLSAKAPPEPWMYTGGLENHRFLVDLISRNRPLWGNGAISLSIARSPGALAKIYRANEIRFPAIHESLTDPPRTGGWLIKPRNGAGGREIHFLEAIVEKKLARQNYLQEFIEGIPCSAVYVGLDKGARLLGTTRQLVGEPWLNAAPFHYCGSIGPLGLEPPTQKEIEKIGNVLARECSLRGLFGVDFVLSQGTPWPVEVNPRYPASAEILEYALGIQAMAWHRWTFDTEMREPPVANAPGSETPFVGKAILFAKRSLGFPKTGPWKISLNSKSMDQMPDFADIPEPGRVIRAGAPILTFFNQSATMDGCLDKLKECARNLDHLLFRR